MEKSGRLLSILSTLQLVRDASKVTLISLMHFNPVASTIIFMVCGVNDPVKESHKRFGRTVANYCLLLEKSMAKVAITGFWATLRLADHKEDLTELTTASVSLASTS